MSSWARYLKNKYGNRSSKDTAGTASATTREPPSSASASADRNSSATSAARRLSLGLPLRQANELAISSDDDSKNGHGSPTSPTAAAVGIITGAAAGTSPRAQYLQKRRQLFQLGGRGSEPGCFTWPRGVAIGPDNSIVVADSSNHRVQVGGKMVASMLWSGVAIGRVESGWYELFVRHFREPHKVRFFSAMIFWLIFRQEIEYSEYDSCTTSTS